MLTVQNVNSSATIRTVKVQVEGRPLRMGIDMGTSASLRPAQVVSLFLVDRPHVLYPSDLVRVCGSGVRLILYREPSNYLKD